MMDMDAAVAIRNAVNKVIAEHGPAPNAPKNILVVANYLLLYVSQRTQGTPLAELMHEIDVIEAEINRLAPSEERDLLKEIAHYFKIKAVGFKPYGKGSGYGKTSL